MPFPISDLSHQAPMPALGLVSNALPGAEVGPRPVLNMNVLMPAAIVANLTPVAVVAGRPIHHQLLRLPLRVAFQAVVDGV